MRKNTKRPPPEIIPDPGQPDFLWRRFVSVAYRTTRVLLRARSLLGEGQTLAAAGLYARDMLHASFPLDPADPIAGTASAFYGNRTPVAPTPPTDAADIPAVAGLHGAVAIELGVDPEDPVLFWFDEDQILDHFPTMTMLVDFEMRMVSWAGDKLLSGSRTAARQAITDTFGVLSVGEQADFVRLAYASLADYTATSADEDRALMVARLERVARRAKESMDIRTELAAYRTIAQIQGLTFQDVDQTQKHMRELFSLPPPAEPASSNTKKFLIEE